MIEKNIVASDNNEGIDALKHKRQHLFSQIK